MQHHEKWPSQHDKLYRDKYRHIRGYLSIERIRKLSRMIEMKKRPYQTMEGAADPEQGVKQKKNEKRDKERGRERNGKEAKEERVKDGTDEVRVQWLETLANL